MDSDLLEYLTSFLTPERLDGFDRVLNQRTRFITLVFEELYHQQNASACLRSCDCFGVQDVHVIESTNEFQLDSGVALGAGKWTTVVRHRDSENPTLDCINHLREHGYQLIATSPRTEFPLLSDLAINQKTAILFGNEHDGLSDQLLDAADTCVRIPMAGFTESFNVSVAAAITLYELTAKLRNSHNAWQLSDEEKLELRNDWIQKSLGWKLPSYLKRYQQDRGK